MIKNAECDDHAKKKKKKDMEKCLQNIELKKKK